MFADQINGLDAGAQSTARPGKQFSYQPRPLRLIGRSEARHARLWPYDADYLADAAEALEKWVAPVMKLAG
jgi:hypothetical protein